MDFETIYKKHYTGIYRYCFKVLKHSEDAEDITQLTFIQFLRKANTLVDDNIAAWLKGAARFEIGRLWHYRKYQGKVSRKWRDGELREKLKPCEPEIPLDDENNRHIAASLEARHFAIDDSIAIREALGTLRREDRELLLLHAFGFGTAAIVKATGRKKSIIYVRINNAREQMRQTLSRSYA